MYPMISCREFEAFIIDYLEGELPWSKRAIFNMHLAVCAECRQYLRAYQRSRALGQAVLTGAPDDPVPHEVPEDLIKAVLAAASETDGR